MTGVGWVDEGDLAGNCVLRHYQEEPEVVVLELSTGNLDQRHVRSEETMYVLDERIVRFPRLIG